MDAPDLQQGETATLVVIPPSPWATPTATVRDRKGALVASPDATPSDVDTIVDSSTDPATFTVADAAGIVRGLTVQVTDDQWGAADSVVASVAGTTVKLVTPLPGTPSGGATVKGLDIEVELDAVDATATLGKSFLLEIRQDGVTRRRVFNVCVYPFVGPMLEQTVREHMMRHWPGEKAVHGAEWGRRCADQVNRMIRGRLIESDKYISEYWDPGALEEVSLLALDLVLFRKGYRYPGTNPDDFYRSTDIQLEARLGALLKSSLPSDSDLDGEIDDDEVDGDGDSVIVR